ncbi:DUF2946 domain-containing protein [Variovorax sp. 770b2]|uniref:DUF2946 domain-containing protein n=1 Tax=Variovorax sp. 770b2 TaxID=1566271 RepID=UPI0008E9D850|nr:DUF2946 domain-containing protein [Variovorax sp. 770b2]SFQ33017.1 Protein of unknown function [Variovorax sp. 770b2]
MNLRRIRSRVLWIAILAVLFGVLAPSLSTWVAETAGKAWTEVCTASGTKLVQVDGDDTPTHDGHNGSMHCPYCRLQQDLPAIAHAPGVRILADGSVRGVPRVAVWEPPLAVSVWPAPPSRAPPVFS